MAGKYDDLVTLTQELLIYCQTNNPDEVFFGLKLKELYKAVEKSGNEGIKKKFAEFFGEKSEIQGANFDYNKAVQVIFCVADIIARIINLIDFITSQNDANSGEDSSATDT